MQVSKSKATSKPALSEASLATSALHSTLLPITEYDRRIADYARRIHRSVDMGAIEGILHQALRETSPLTDGAAVVAGAAAREIAALKSELASLRSLVHLDSLTGILNRGGLAKVFAREAARADRSLVPLGVALIDIDDFKTVNDAHGHAAGDAALIYIVQTLARCLRPSDALVRFGGDELLVVLPAIERSHPAAAIKRVLHELECNPLVYEQQELALSFSGGVAVRERGETLDQVIARVDTGLYRAKRNGKRAVVSVN